MALFNFPYINHGEAPLLIQDLLVYVKLALREAGHDVYISRYVEGGAINIFFEAFGDRTAELVQRYAAAGVKIVVIATETVTGDTFNDYDDALGDAGWYGRRENWEKRYANFLKVAQVCAAVWCLSENQAAGYAGIVPAGALHVLPFGYVAGYGIVRQMPERLKDIDFSFIGMPTKRRKFVLGELRRRGLAVAGFEKLLPGFIRANILARSKICLSIKQYDNWKYSSLVRNYFHLMNGSFMLGEICEIPSVLDPYVAQADSDAFVATCLAACRRADLAQTAAANLERFRQERPLRPAFAAFLERGLGP